LTRSPRQKTPRAKPSTETFNTNLVNAIARHVLGTPKTPKTTGNEATLTLYRPAARSVTVIARPGSRNDLEVQAADVILGMHALAKAKNQRIDRVIVKWV